MQITHERRHRLCSGVHSVALIPMAPGARCDLWWNQCNTTSCSYVISNLADIWHVCSCIISYSGTSGHFAAHPSSRVKDSRCAPSALNHPPLLASAHRLHYSSLTDARDTHSVSSARMREIHAELRVYRYGRDLLLKPRERTAHAWERHMWAAPRFSWGRRREAQWWWDALGRMDDTPALASSRSWFSCCPMRWPEVRELNCSRQPNDRLFHHI